MATKFKMSEKQLQQAVIDAARRLHYRVAHFPKAQNARGVWLTTVAADAKGFPDLVLVKRLVIFVELKDQQGHLKPEQQDWKEALERAKAHHFVVRPETLDDFLELLKKWGQ